MCYSRFCKTCNKETFKTCKSKVCPINLLKFNISNSVKARYPNYQDILKRINQYDFCECYEDKNGVSNPYSFEYNNNESCECYFVCLCEGICICKYICLCKQNRDSFVSSNFKFNKKYLMNGIEPVEKQKQGQNYKPEFIFNFGHQSTNKPKYDHQKYDDTFNNIVKPNKNNIVKPNKNNIVKPNKNNIVKPNKNNIVKPNKNNVVDPLFDVDPYQTHVYHENIKIIKTTKTNNETLYDVCILISGYLLGKAIC
jgi:hypothetical protein